MTPLGDGAGASGEKASTAALDALAVKTPSEVLMCRNGLNVVAGRKVPIIFIPGIMGSRLNLENPWWPDQQWDPDWVPNLLGWATTGPERMRSLLHAKTHATLIKSFCVPQRFPPVSNWLCSRHNTWPISADRKARGWTTVAMSSYGPFLEFLESKPFGSNRTPVYACGYDWRQDIWNVSRKSITDDILGGPAGHFGPTGILGKENAESCILITHSMGGLVARAAMKDNPTLQSKVLGVMHVVQPATGAPVLYRRCVIGSVKPYDGEGAEGTIFTHMLGSSGPSFATVASGLTGALELLPSNLYRNACQKKGVSFVSYTKFEENRAVIHRPDESVYTTYGRAETAAPPGIVRTDVSPEVTADLKKRIEQAKTFHTNLGSWKLPGKTWAIYSTACNTDGTVHFDLPPDKKQIHTHYESVGDGMPVATYRYAYRPGTDEEIRIDEVRDLERLGFNPDRDELEAHKPSRRGCVGDGTVPYLSGDALFPDQPQVFWNADSINFAGTKQFEALSLEHEPIFKDEKIQSLVRRWIAHVITTAS